MVGEDVATSACDIHLCTCFIPAGTRLLPAAEPYARAALSSPHQALRVLGATQLGRLLLLQADNQQQAMTLQTALLTALQVRSSCHCTSFGCMIQCHSTQAQCARK